MLYIESHLAVEISSVRSTLIDYMAGPLLMSCLYDDAQMAVEMLDELLMFIRFYELLDK